MKDCLETITFIITIIGFPVALFTYYQSKIKERAQKSSEIYNSLDDKYIDFLKLCLENSTLNISLQKKESTLPTTGDDRTKSLLIYEVLISLLERAHILFKSELQNIPKEQKEGWEGYRDDWINVQAFRQAWKLLGSQYEKSFVELMDKKIAEHKT